MSEKKRYLIYQITNNVNGKIYIGKHETFNIDDDYFGSGKVLGEAIKKYGFENFTKTILFELQNEEEMNLLEKMVVTEEFCKRDDVYNLNVGGDGGWNYVNANVDRDYRKMRLRNALQNISVEDKAKQIEKHTIAIQLHWEKFGHNWLGKHHTEKTKQKMKQSRYDGHGKNNSMFGKMWICNDLTKESKVIPKTELIPIGWRQGRFCKK